MRLRHRSLLRWLTVSVLTSATLGAGLAQGPLVAQGKKEPTERVLRRTTIISGNTSGSVPVRIDREVSVDSRNILRRRSGPNPSIEINGRGRFIGVLLTPIPPPENNLEGGLFLAGQYRECGQRACQSRGKVFNYTLPGEFGRDRSRFKLAAGNYLLRLIADGAPSRVKLYLPGLGKGTTHLQPQGPAGSSSKSPVVRMSIEGDMTLHSAGSTYISSGTGIFVTMMFIRGRDLGESRIGECIYNHVPREEIAWGPQCSALVRAGFGPGLMAHHVGRPGKQTFVLFFAGPLRSDTWGFELGSPRGFGLWHLSQGEVTATGAHALFVSFDNVGRPRS